MTGKRKNRKKSSAIRRRLILGLLGVLIGINFYLINSATLSGNRLPTPFGYGISAVLSGSMEPTISVGDLIVVKQTDDFTVGDIVVYQSGSAAIVHRIIDMDGDAVITKGDANNVPDEAFDKSCVKGVVTVTVPYLGSVMWALKSPVGILAMLGAAILLMELSFRREKAEKADEQEQMRAEIRALLDELQIDETKN